MTTIGILGSGHVGSFDAVDIGGLGESWRVDAGQPAFVVRQDVAKLKANVAKARRGS